LDGPAITDDAQLVIERLRERGPSFFRDLAVGVSFDPDRLRMALSALVAAGLVAADGFAGLRMLVAAERGRAWPLDRRPNLAGREAATAHDVRLQAGRVEEILLRALRDRPA